MGIDNYLCAKEDVENAAVPTRDNGIFGFTNGMMKILERPQFEQLRSFTANFLQLENQKSDLATRIIEHEATLEVLEEENANKEKVAQESLEIKSHALAAQKDKKANHERVMRSNGLKLVDTPEVKQSTPVESVDSSRPWKARLRSFGIFVAIETLAFVASYVILRENLSDMEVFTRLFANGTVFFIIDYLLRKKDHTGRSVFLVIFLTLYTLMLLTPLFTEYISGTTNTGADPWAFDTGVDTTVETPLSFGDFLLKNSSLVLVVLAIICLVIYLGFFNKAKIKKTKTKVSAPPIQQNRSEANVMYESLHAFEREVGVLEKDVEKMKSHCQDLPFQLLSDFSFLKDTLLGLDEKWQGLGQQQEMLKQQVSSALDRVLNELKEYQDHYQSMLSTTANALVFKPQWPTEQDLRQYYKLQIQEA